MKTISEIQKKLAQHRLPLPMFVLEELEERDDKIKDVLAALEEAQQQAELAYAAYEGLQGFCVSRGEYDSLLNKHSVLSRAHREAQQTIARLTVEAEESESYKPLYRMDDEGNLHQIERGGK